MTWAWKSLARVLQKRRGSVLWTTQGMTQPCSCRHRGRQRGRRMKRLVQRIQLLQRRPRTLSQPAALHRRVNAEGNAQGQEDRVRFAWRMAPTAQEKSPRARQSDEVDRQKTLTPTAVQESLRRAASRSDEVDRRSTCRSLSHRSRMVAPVNWNAMAQRDRRSRSASPPQSQASATGRCHRYGCEKTIRRGRMNGSLRVWR